MTRMEGDRRPIASRADVRRTFFKGAWFLWALGMAVYLSTVTPGYTAQTFTNTLGQNFVLIPAGIFMMGSPTNEPDRDPQESKHQVTISKAFYMQTTAVTQRQYKTLMGKNPSDFSDCGDDCPVEHVTWFDVQEFINRLNAKEGGNNYRLPTEAEWEYAARAGTSGPYYFGNNPGQLGDYGWYLKNSEGEPHPVGAKRPNAWGLYDMHGNVWEWCQDRFGNYPLEAVIDPQGPNAGLHRVIRGGSWSSTPANCRAASRYKFEPDNRGDDVGFRLVRVP